MCNDHQGRPCPAHAEGLYIEGYFWEVIGEAFLRPAGERTVREARAEEDRDA